VIRGDKIALVGANGKGKSTLMRIISGMEPFEGERSGWHNVKESFYAQHQLESLHLEHSVLDEMKNCGSGKTELELRQLLGCFLFSGDDVFKKIKVLSGGEKARVALAKVIAGKANFLLLDEPTNHLDMQSVELLIEALNKYEGTYILISHDRYFVSRTANKYWEIEEGKVNSFSGTYEEFVTWKADKAEREKKSLGIPPVTPPKKEKPLTEVKPQVDSKVQNDKKRELQKQQKAFEKLEEQLNKLESEKLKLEQDLAQPDIFTNRERFQITEQKYKDCVVQVDKMRKEYDVLFEQLLHLEA
jgi:ATP-binding cassette subfamily F protein 3